MNLRIYLTAHWQDAASVCAWALLDDAGNVRESGNGTLASMPHSDDATVIVSAERVLATTAVLPKIKRSKLETALPFALEDALIDEATEAHVTPGAKLADGRTVLYTLNKNWLARFLAASAACQECACAASCPNSACCRRAPANGAWHGMARKGFWRRHTAWAVRWTAATMRTHRSALQLRLQTRMRPPRCACLRLAAKYRRRTGASAFPSFAKSRVSIGARHPFPAMFPTCCGANSRRRRASAKLWPWLRPALMAALLLFGVEVVHQQPGMGAARQ